MGFKSTVALVAVAAAVIAGGAYVVKHRGATSRPALEAVLSTPPGITFQWVHVGNVVQVAGASSDQQALVTVFADATGKTLYRFDKDVEAGKSACAGDCAAAWPAAAAPADAKPVGYWSVIARDDGSKQWAYKGKPLYTNVKDVKIGDNNGQNVDQIWHMAELKPAEGMQLPYGIGVQEIAAAPGQGLVDSRGHALYAFDGSVENGVALCGDAPCGRQWRPLTTGQLANAMGEFSIISRDDGIQQWAFKDHPLYLFTGDVELGDANGKGADPHFQLALLERYFVPEGVSILPNERKGGLLVGRDGMTLYARDRVSYNGTGGHSARGADRGNPEVGHQIGLSGCDESCAKDWKPLIAAADARPSGYWTLFDRADGTRQWGYQGYALYSYAGDRKPGDIIGQDMYDLVVNDSTEKLADARHGLGLYWRTTSP